MIANIRTYGWHCTSVGGDDETPGFTYTVGLFETCHFPELIVIGLSGQLAHSLLSIAAKAAADGRPLDLGRPCPGLLADADCVFVEVPEDRYDDWVLSACWYYRGSDFPLYQLVWPSVDGPYPWQRDADERLRALQPVLGEPPIERGATGARSASDFRIGSWLKAGAQ